MSEKVEKFSPRQAQQMFATLRKVKAHAVTAIRIGAMEVLREIEEEVDKTLASFKTVEDTRPKLSKRQKDILDYIQSFHDEHGYMPNHRQLKAAMGINVTAIAGHLRMLQKKGYLTWIKNKARTFKILEPGDEPVSTNGV